MTIQTIEDIKSAIKEIDAKLRTFVVKDHENETYGQENEYTARSLKAGIKAALADLRRVARSPETIIRILTSQERRNLADNLQAIDQGLHEQNYSSVAEHFEQLKVRVRNSQSRVSQEIQEDLEDRRNKLGALISDAEENVEQATKLIETAERTQERIDQEEEKFSHFLEKLQELHGREDEISGLHQQSEEKCQNIEDLLTSAKSREELINSFANNIEKRSQDLERQKASTEGYEAKLKAYKEEHDQKLTEADNLIKKASEALQYTTSAGVSAAFSERYVELKESGGKNWLWLLGAGTFVGVAMSIGFGFLLGSSKTNPEALSSAGSAFYFAIQKVTMMSVAIYAAWFCASQYTKYKNTLEDYGYKSVLAKSLIAFLDTLKGEERENYLNKVLNEIHKDPLRKRHDMDQPGPVSLLKELRKKDPKNPDMPTE